MNKRFSTLLVGLTLFGTAATYAQDDAAATTTPDLSVPSLKEGVNTRLYQLKTGDSFLVINADGKLAVVDDASAQLANSLWCVTVTAEGQGKAPIFDFVNKGAEALLTVTMDEFEGDALATTTAPVVGGEVGGWAFSKTYATSLEKEKGLYSYFTKDSVVGIVVTDGAVTLKKELAEKVKDDTFAQFTLVKASSFVLTADQINTKLGQQKEDEGVTLTFDPNRNNTSLKNPFSDIAFLATAVENEDGFVNITKEEDGKALVVDTAYTNTKGDKFLAFKYLDDLDELADSDLKDQGAFKFTYYPTEDSLVIQVKQATRLTADVTDWKTALTIAACKTVLADDNAEVNYVTVQDLLEADEVRIVTIADEKETDIKLGFSGCQATDDDRVSLNDGLYLIKNAKTGKYYASPIHIDGHEAEWVSVDADEQNVNHMPAYQWVVLKNKTSEYFKDKSDVVATNREYPSLEDSYQFTQAAGSKLYYCEALAEDSLEITQITDKEILSDKYLGYKYLTNDELMITNYAFNYFNPYTMNKYIAQVEGSDKLNALQEVPTYFEVVAANAENKAEAYGYTVDAVVKARIKDLAQLERAAYQIKSGDKAIVLGAENNYVLSDEEDADAVTFFFKENNETAKGCYYAFIDNETTEANDAGVKYFVNKLGVADQSLKALLQEQVIAEVRTSAFSIGLADLPLYRRFNTALENAVEGQEDAVKFLKFKEYYRGEYLMDENNKKFQNEGMNYLGIWTADKATGLSFYVDSAVILNTKQGYIKPQYFIYVDRKVADPVPGDKCNENTPHFDINGDPTDAEHCVHAKPGKAGYIRAKYLVSFADSLEAENADKLYQFGKYTRVGFVDAMHIGDSLIFLVNGFEKLPLADLDTAKIIANYKATENEDKIIDLAALTDAHHNYTWSFRFISPEKVAAATAAGDESLDVAFLFESNKAENDKDIAPSKGQWLKSQNGCLVLSNDTEFEKAKLGGSEDNALIFNIENGTVEDLATDNETIATSEVTVIAGEGQLTIAGAAGKKVVISNILGQVVANTVIASDNATIAAPAGVVVVAVEGEEAVKAIVK